MTKTPADLIAKWRAHADQQMQWSRESDTKGDGANSHTERARARIYRECADELTTLLSGEGESRREQEEKDSGAGLAAAQTIPDVAGTEPRPVCACPGDCCRELSRVWDALGIHHYNSKSASENVADLRRKINATK